MDVTIKTLNGDGENDRNVTLHFRDVEGYPVELLGALPHGSIIVVDQELVDDLQKLVIEQLSDFDRLVLDAVDRCERHTIDNRIWEAIQDNPDEIGEAKLTEMLSWDYDDFENWYCSTDY